MEHFFLEYKEELLYVVLHYPKTKEVKGAFVLLAGLGENLCDLDYFMKYLASDLAENGFLVLQVDLVGHGESTGIFSDICNERIIEETLFCISILKDKGYENIGLICRGYLSNLFSREIPKGYINFFLGISPIKLFTTDLQKIGNVLHEDFLLKNFYELFTNQKDVDRFVIALGSEPVNLYTESITKKFLTQIVDVLYLEDDENDSFEKFLLSFDIIDEKIILNKRISDIAPKTLSYYEGYAFRRNICTQSMLRIKIISIVCRCFG